MNGPVQPISINVGHLGEVQTACSLVRDFAMKIGFGELESEEIVLVAAELGTNLVKHAQGGMINLSVSEGGHAPGIVMEAINLGPGIRDVELAMVDGFSTAGTLGAGLGTVIRKMDEVDFYAEPEGGFRVVCRRHPRPDYHGFQPRYLDFGVATRPRRNQGPNGDAFVIKCWDTWALAGIIDGLGHGEEARRAAQSARSFIEAHFDLSLDLLFKGVDRVCHSTRGVAMALVRFDLSKGMFQVASIGNIETRLRGGEIKPAFIVRRGIVGLNSPNPVITEHPWSRNSALFLFSDGIHSRWSFEELPGHLRDSPSELSHHLLMSQGNYDDDATIMIVENCKNE